MNATVWLGASVFFLVAARPAFSSLEMESLLGLKNFPYFSDAIVHIVLTRYFHLQLACSIVAVLHFLAEYLYLGRRWEKFSVGLLAVLLALSVLGSSWLGPQLHELHENRFRNPAAAEREKAMKSFRFWTGFSQLANVLTIGGLIIYVWRVANPSDSTRFVSAGKFRG
jgi:hypothetical protein